MIGEETVNNIPIYVLPKGFKAGQYPQLWKKPEDMPADVVKCVLLGNNRPVLAIRFVDFETYQLACRIFFQRYSDAPKNWASSEKLVRRPISIWDQKKGFAIIKHIIEESPLNLTDNRALLGLVGKL